MNKSKKRLIKKLFSHPNEVKSFLAEIMPITYLYEFWAEKFENRLWYFADHPKDIVMLEYGNIDVIWKPYSQEEIENYDFDGEGEWEIISDTKQELMEFLNMRLAGVHRDYAFPFTLPKDTPHEKMLNLAYEHIIDELKNSSSGEFFLYDFKTENEITFLYRYLDDVASEMLSS